MNGPFSGIVEVMAKISEAFTIGYARAMERRREYRNRWRPLSMQGNHLDPYGDGSP